MEYLVLVLEPEPETLKVVEDQLNSAESVTRSFEARARVIGKIEAARARPHWTERLEAELERAA